MRLDLADDRLRGAGVVAGGVRGLWLFGVNAERDRRDIGDDFRACDAIRRDGRHRVFQGQHLLERAVPNCIPRKSASAAIKAAEVSGRRMLKIDMRNFL